MNNSCVLPVAVPEDALSTGFFAESSGAVRVLRAPIGIRRRIAGVKVQGTLFGSGGSAGVQIIRPCSDHRIKTERNRK